MHRRTTLALIGSLAATAGAARLLGAAAEAQSFLDYDGFPYDVFDARPQTRLQVGGGTIKVAFAPGRIDLARPKILDWVHRAATAVSIYYGHFPVASVRVLIVPAEGGGVQGGTTWGYRGAAIRMLVGSDCDSDDLDSDWMMTHEFVHTALPHMPPRYNWLSEGLAVYVEPIARVQAGFLTPRQIWADMKRDMPKGLPHVDDEGLDNTPTWGRTYWGGAIFCLLADLGIRRATQNRLGLQDAMRGVLADGGTHEFEWPIARILATADKAVGLTVMRDLYAKFGDSSESVDLIALWKQVGVDGAGADLYFDDTAPFAAARLAITARPAAG